MKKRIVLILSVVLMFSLLVSCGGGDKTSKTQDPADIKGETFDGGNISAFVPKNWAAFHGTDIFDDYPDLGYDPNYIRLIKDGKEEFDIFSHPYMEIHYYDSDTIMLEPSKDWYDDGTNLEPLKLDNYTWQGFSAISSNYPVTILWTNDSDQMEILIFTEMDKGKVSLDDADVRAILSSIAVTGEE